MLHDENEDSRHEVALRMKKHALEAIRVQGKFDAGVVTLEKEILSLEREIAEKRGEPVALEWNSGAKWNGLIYSPQVFGGAFSCAIIFGTKDSEYEVLCFEKTEAYKLSNIGDEVLAGHPLIGKGLAPYRTFIIKNSNWISELESIDREHINHDASRWRITRHYLLCFKDRMFEAIAREVVVLGAFGTVEDATRVAVKAVR